MNADMKTELGFTAFISYPLLSAAKSFASSLCLCGKLTE